MSKHQLTISPKYVSDWTYIEGVREIFQNALDNEVKDPNNAMYFNYDAETETLVIGNKTSKLELNTLLMGYSTKRDDEDTIGQHGEGYKVAIMVLLRESKEVTIVNYGNRELWTTRFIKSRKFAGEMLVEVTVNKNHVFKKTPHNNLEFIIEGITPNQFETLKEYNLNISQLVEGEEVLTTPRGRVLLSDKYSGKMFVGGLYISTDDNFKYGYDFKPSLIRLDRDRRLINDFDLTVSTAKILGCLEDKSIVRGLVAKEAKDIMYYTHFCTHDKDEYALRDGVYEDFVAEHGDDAIPVSSNDELKEALSQGVSNPIIVSDTMMRIVSPKVTHTVRLKLPKELMMEWFERISYKLDDDERLEFTTLISRI